MVRVRGRGEGTRLPLDTFLHSWEELLLLRSHLGGPEGLRCVWESGTGWRGRQSRSLCGQRCGEMCLWVFVIIPGVSPSVVLPDQQSWEGSFRASHWLHHTQVLGRAQPHWGDSHPGHITPNPAPGFPSHPHLPMPSCTLRCFSS